MALPGPPTIEERGESEPPDSWPNLLPTFKMKVAGADTPEASSGRRLPRENSSVGPGPRALPPTPLHPPDGGTGSMAPSARSLPGEAKVRPRQDRLLPAFQPKGLPQVS